MNGPTTLSTETAQIGLNGLLKKEKDVKLGVSGSWRIERDEWGMTMIKYIV